MDDIQWAIFHLLHEREPDAMESDEIMDVLQNLRLIRRRGRTNEPVHDAIRSMVNNYEQLIGGDTNGYYLIRTRQEAIETIRSLQSKSRSISERIDVLRNNWNLQHPNEPI